MSELTTEQHNNEIWAKLAKLQSQIDELRKDLKPIEAVEEIPLHILNGDAVANRMAEFAKRDAAKDALNSVLAQANAAIISADADADADTGGEGDGSESKDGDSGENGETAAKKGRGRPKAKE